MESEMSTSVDMVGGMASPGEGEDGFGDDPRLDKKKKFKPFQKMRNFFRGGSSKKRFKPDESGSQKAHSTSALHHGAVGGDNDDDGGFRSKSHVLAGSRSISEDSIFKPETKEPTPGVLENKTVSMENIETNPFQTELFMKLRSRQSDSDIDEGLPYSPLTTLTPHGLMFHMTRQSVPATTGKSTSQESEQSLISVDGSDEDLFSSNWKSGVASVRTARSSSMDSLPEDQMDVSDFESVQMRTTTSLSNEAAKHRISVKPKSRRLSSKMSMKRRDRSPAPPQLPDVKEESPTKTLPDTQASMPHKTVISTTIPVGPPSDAGVNVIPRSEPRAIPSKSVVKDMAKSEPSSVVMRRGEDIERSTRPRSLSPLSTSPVSQSMIQEVKLRPRPTSGKFEGVDIKKDSPEQKSDNELAKAFTRAKRFSKKFDEDGNVIDTTKSPVKVQTKEPDKSTEMSKSVTLPKEEPKTTTVSSPVKDKEVSPGVSSPVSGVSFVLKKEPLRPGNKQEGSVTRSGSVETKDTPKLTPVVNTQSAVSEVPKTNITTDNNQKKDTKDDTSSPSKTVKLGSPEKLASPREEYRLKRAARSKTLPVSSEMIEKAEEAEKSPASSRLGSPPLRSRRNDYDNVIIETKSSSIQSKRSSWASSSVTTATSAGTSEPAWVVRARLKKMEQEEKEKADVAKEVKVEIKSTNNNSVNKTEILETESVTKTSDKTQTELKTDIPKGTVQTSGVKPWAQNYTAKPFEKPVATVTAKSSFEKNSNSSSVGTKALFDKPSVHSVKPPVSVSTEQSSQNKPTVTTSSVKQATPLGSKPAFTAATKPAVSSVSKPAVSTNFAKLTASAARASVASTGSSSAEKSATPLSKPSVTVSSTNSDKPLTQTGKVTGFGGVSSTTGFSRSFSQKSTTTPVQKTPLDNKPVQSIGSKSFTMQKTDTKDPVVKPTPVVSINKDNKKSENDIKNTTTAASTVKTGSSIDKPKPTFGNSKPETTSSVPAWKQALNQKKSAGTGQVKIEIIDKETETKPPKKVDEKQNVQVREKPKTAPEKCSDISSNRPSKVLDMVKSFQNLQVK